MVRTKFELFASSVKSNANCRPIQGAAVTTLLNAPFLFSALTLDSGGVKKRTQWHVSGVIHDEKRLKKAVVDNGWTQKCIKFMLYVRPFVSARGCKISALTAVKTWTICKFDF